MRKAILILLAMVAVASADPWAARLGEWVALQQRRAVGELWTPADLDGLALWFDASDSSTLWADTNATTAATNNGLVARWDDKSGNERNYTNANTANQPNKISNAVDFSPRNSWLEGTRPHGTTGDFVVIAAADVANVSTIYTAGDLGFLGANPIASDWGIWLRRFADYDFGYVRASPVAAFLVLADASEGNRVFWGARAGSTIKAAYNGGTVASVAASDTAHRVGDRRQTTTTRTHGNDKINEVVILSGYDLPTIRKVEGYLAHKWGLAANLPSDHPYKNSPPTK